MDSQLKDAKNIVQEFQEIFTDPVASLWGGLGGAMAPPKLWGVVTIL